jgi:hypothetical protein
MASESSFPAIGTIFSDERVTITERTVTIDGFSIRVADITAARIEPDGDKTVAVWMVLVGGFVAFANVYNYFDEGQFRFGVFVTFFLVFIVGVFALRLPPRVRLRIDTEAHGARTVLEKNPKPYVEMILRQIRVAMDGRFGDRRNIVDSSR